MHRAEGRHDHDVRHQRDDARRLRADAAEEVLRVRQLLFEPQDLAHAADRHAEVRPLVLAVADLRAAGVAAEIVADERADEPLRARWRRRREQHEEPYKNDRPCMIRMHRNLAWSWHRPDKPITRHNAPMRKTAALVLACAAGIAAIASA